MRRVVRKFLRAVVDHDPEYYDMYADPNETFFGRLYLERIQRHAEAAGIRPPARVVEAGCQAGRLLIPLAKMGFDVTGIDTSRYALRRAREHATAAGVDVKLVQGNLMGVLNGAHRGRYDIVVCAEVLYLSREYRAMLHALASAVKPGGLLCVSHRSTWYYQLEAVRRDDVETAREVSARSEGPFFDSAYFNWQTEEELRALYAPLEPRGLSLYPIDRLAWLSGISPSQLSGSGREGLLQLELEDGAGHPTCARYVLVIAEIAPEPDHLR